MAIFVAPNSVTHMVRTIIPYFTYTFNVPMVFLRGASQFTVYDISRSLSLFSVFNANSIQTRRICVMLQVESARQSKFQFRPQRDNSNRNYFHLSRAFRRLSTNRFMRHIRCNEIWNFTNGNAVLRKQRIMFYRIFTCRRARSNEEYTREYSTMILCRLWRVNQYRFLIIMRRCNYSNGPLSVRFSPCNFPPANINGHRIRTIFVRIIPRASNRSVPRQMNRVIYRRLQITNYAKDGVRR